MVDIDIPGGIDLFPLYKFEKEDMVLFWGKIREHYRLRMLSMKRFQFKWGYFFNQNY